MGLSSQAAQLARRQANQHERIAELAEIERANLPRNEGDMLGTLQWFDARTGQCRRWVVRIGDRIDRITVESPRTERSKSHGWTWFFTNIRKKILLTPTRDTEQSLGNA